MIFFIVYDLKKCLKSEVNFIKYFFCILIDKGGGLITGIRKRLSFGTSNNRIFLKIGENILYLVY